MGLANLTNLFSPSHIVIGGALRQVVSGCLDSVRNSLKAGVVQDGPVPSVRIARNGHLESAIGAASLAHQRTFGEARFGFHRVQAGWKSLLNSDVQRMPSPLARTIAPALFLTSSLP